MKKQYGTNKNEANTGGSNPPLSAIFLCLFTLKHDAKATKSFEKSIWKSDMEKHPPVDSPGRNEQKG